MVLKIVSHTSADYLISVCWVNIKHSNSLNLINTVAHHWNILRSCFSFVKLLWSFYAKLGWDALVYNATGDEFVPVGIFGLQQMSLDISTSRHKIRTKTQLKGTFSPKHLATYFLMFHICGLKKEKVYKHSLKTEGSNGAVQMATKLRQLLNNRVRHVHNLPINTLTSKLIPVVYWWWSK